MKKENARPYADNDWQSSLLAAINVGWYWTDHLKTELEVGGGTRATTYRARPVLIDGSPTFEFIESTSSRRVLGISQHYQFFRNAWFHPHVSIGVDIVWEQTTDRIEPAIVYDHAARRDRVAGVEPGEVRRTGTFVRPSIATGFKGYMTHRAFFRSDLKLAIRGRVDDVALRFGFGVDF